MGTTLTAAALVVGNDGRDLVALANVGDSRAYLFTAGQLTRITADHSLAEEKVRYGELTEAEAAVHPHRHILTRALGVAATVDVDLWELHLRTGDRLLLCSDGLTNEVSEQRITAVLGSVADPEAVARQLVDAANDHGGNDNITVVIVDVLVGDDDVATADVIDPRPGAPAGLAPVPLPPPQPAGGAVPAAGETGRGPMAATPPIAPWVGAGAGVGTAGASSVPAAQAGGMAADLLVPPAPPSPPSVAVPMLSRRSDGEPRAETRGERRRRATAR
jgi:protein phosphatase